MNGGPPLSWAIAAILPRHRERTRTPCARPQGGGQARGAQWVSAPKAEADAPGGPGQADDRPLRSAAPLADSHAFGAASDAAGMSFYRVATEFHDPADVSVTVGTATRA